MVDKKAKKGKMKKIATAPQGPAEPQGPKDAQGIKPQQEQMEPQKGTTGLKGY